MIGGMMLLCAVGAMVLIAWWALPRDDMSDVDAMSGLLGLRRVSERTLARKQGGAAPKRGKRRRAPGQGRSRRSANPVEESDAPTPKRRRRR